MTYLAEIESDTPNFTWEDFKVTELLTESKSLAIINPILAKRGFPLINSLSLFRQRGIEIVYRKGTIYYFILDGDNDNSKIYTRDFRLKELLRNNSTDNIP